MSLLIIYPDYDLTQWLAAFQQLAPELKIQVWPEVSKPDAVEFALCWQQTPNALKQFPNLKGISSYGAGVNHLLDDPTLPTGIPLVRVVDGSLQQSMAEYILHAVLDHFRQFYCYRKQQKQAQWRPISLPQLSEVTIGIMGCGELGQFVGRKLRDIGGKVQTWGRTKKSLTGMTSFAGEKELTGFLQQTDILICLLPLTAATENILNAEVFNQLPAGAFLINAARGHHLVDEDLLAALDGGQLSAARLDVFRQEPLPKEHPFWTHPKITVTPHIASLTNPRTAAKQILENYHRAINGEPLLNQVCRQRGY